MTDPRQHGTESSVAGVRVAHVDFALDESVERKLERLAHAARRPVPVLGRGVGTIRAAVGRRCRGRRSIPRARKETHFHVAPCIAWRDETEWTETIEAISGLA